MIRNRILTLEKEVSPLSYQQLKDVPGSGYLKSFLIFTKNFSAKWKRMYKHKSSSALCYGSWGRTDFPIPPFSVKHLLHYVQSRNISGTDILMILSHKLFP